MLSTLFKKLYFECNKLLVYEACMNSLCHKKRLDWSGSDSGVEEDVPKFNWNQRHSCFLFVDNLLWLFCFCRCLPVVLDSLLCPPHNKSPLSWLPCPASPDERGDVARLRQQRSQPRHLHHLQHRVQELLQKVSTSLLLEERLIRTCCRCRMDSTFQKTSKSVLASVDLNVASVFVLCEVLFLCVPTAKFVRASCFPWRSLSQDKFQRISNISTSRNQRELILYAKCIFSE